MFEQYLKERKNESMIKVNDGFIVFKIIGNVCLISEIYIRPEFRQNKIASHLADQVFKLAKLNECDEVQCLVDVSTPIANLSMISILHYGFKPYQCEGNNIIRFYKGVE